MTTTPSPTPRPWKATALAYSILAAVLLYEHGPRPELPWNALGDQVAAIDYEVKALSLRVVDLEAKPEPKPAPIPPVPTPPKPTPTPIDPTPKPTPTPVPTPTPAPADERLTYPAWIETQKYITGFPAAMAAIQVDILDGKLATKADITRAMASHSAPLLKALDTYLPGPADADAAGTIPIKNAPHAAYGFGVSADAARALLSGSPPK